LSRAALAELNMLPIFNIPYSPQFNGIESYFSLLKLEYKKLLLKNILNEISYEVPALIKQSLKAVSNQKAMNCARNGREAIEKQALI
jgi:hypothetical protein